tara:strand:- start:244 stop:888 length:645 start_codon:yes stop_codon:yes gene_type:complete
MKIIHELLSHYMKHTKRELASTAKRTSSFNEFIREIFGKTDGNSWRKGKRLVERFDIDTSHYKIAKYPKKLLEEVVTKSYSVKEMCDHLNIKVGSGPYVKKKAKEMGIDFSHFKKRSFPKPKKLTWKEVLTKRDGDNRRSPYILRRCLVESGRTYKCETDGCLISNKWIGKTITLQVHHIDGDCLNNKPNNLMFLCPNCHTQTSNWCYKGGKDG